MAMQFIAELTFQLCSGPVSLLVTCSVVYIGVLTLEHENLLSCDWYREFI